MFQLEQQSAHVAYIIAEAGRKSGLKRPIIEPSQTAEEAW
jgi:hypothetical protein